MSSKKSNIAINSSEIIERLKMALNIRKDIDLARFLGISQSTLATWKIRNSIKWEIIFEKCNNINLNWLLTGEGEMFLNSTQENPNLPAYDKVKIRYYPNVVASAGFGRIAENEQYEVIEMEKSFLRAIGITSFTDLILVKVLGDSMEPFIQNGEYVITELTQEASNSNIVIARIKDDVYIKKLLKDPLNRWVKLVSENDLYPDIMLQGEEVNNLQIIGIVRAKIKSFY